MPDEAVMTATDSAVATEVSPVIGDNDAGAAVPETEPITTGEPETQPTEAQPTEQPAEGPIAAPAEEPFAPEQPVPLPKELRALMADKELAAHPTVAAAIKTLQSTYDRLNAYTLHFPAVADAKKFAEAFPGGLQDALEAQRKAQEWDTTDTTFYSRNPEQHRELTKSWAQDDPEAYSVLVRSGLETLAESNPDAYRHLGLDILEQTIGAMQQAAFQRNDQEAANRLGQVHQDVFGRKPGEAPRVDPRDHQLRERERQLQEREQQYGISVASSFMETGNNVVGTRVKTSIEAVVSKALPKINAGQRDDLIGRIYDTIDSKLRSDQSLQNQLSALILAGRRSGRYTAQDQQRYVNAIYAKAQALLRTEGPQLINKWTETFLNVRRADQQKREQAATRTDITGGAAPNLGAPKLTAAQLLDMPVEELNKVPNHMLPNNWRQMMRDERMRRGL